jgi:imidazole glycerol phosphate synthase subunit HisF
MLFYGGGITSIEQIKKIFDLEWKSYIEYEVFDFDLISKAASIYGQSIVVCIDAKLLEDIMYMGEVVRINIKLVLMILLKKVVNGQANYNQSIDNEGSMGVMIWY